jgi:hypothetical protein
MACQDAPAVERNSGQVIDWLLAGDPVIRWQTLRDLAGADQSAFESERARIVVEGWGARLLALQQPDGLWAGGLYGPKWISTTYTMLLLRRYGLSPDNEQARVSCRLLLDRGFYTDGGINYFRSYKYSETCVTGMILSILAPVGGTASPTEVPPTAACTRRSVSSKAFGNTMG